MLHSDETAIPTMRSDHRSDLAIEYPAHEVREIFCSFRHRRFDAGPNHPDAYHLANGVPELRLDTRLERIAQPQVNLSSQG